MSLIESVVKVEPAVEPITLTEAKSWLGVDDGFTDDDDLITGIIVTARINAERFLNRSLITQTREAYWDSIQDRMWIPYAPIIDIILARRFRLNVSTDLTENSDFFVQGIKDKWLRLATPFNLPAGHSPHDRFSEFELRLEYTSGYGEDADDVPQSIRDGIKMMVATFYANRGSITEEEMSTIPADAKMRMYPFKVIL